jgi:aldose 1-epimerase
VTSRISCSPFGVLPDGRAVEAYTLTNRAGMRVVVLTWGGILQAIEVPDRRGATANVTLGFPTLDGYLTQSPYFGAIVGRYANRIAGGRFTLDDRVVTLSANWRSHHLHGGTTGFDRRLWAAHPLDHPHEAGLTLAYTSAAGEEGYPGTLDVAVTYTLTDDGALRIDYRASTDQPTVVNLTSHAYFNLAGEGNGTVADHVVEINAGHFTPVDASLIPTGELATVDGTPLDFRTPTALGARIHDRHPQLVAAGGYDHNYVLDRSGAGLELAARVTDGGESGRILSVHTTEPGVQFYTANQLAVPLGGPSGRPYGPGDGFALETQHFPDSPNHPQFPSTVLRPGEDFTSTTVYTFAVCSPEPYPLSL